MKAVLFDNYGGPEVLYLKEIQKPSPKENEILIKVHATSVNSGDIRMRKADPFAVRFMLGLSKPNKKILGLVYAGVIEETGSKVTLFKKGDQVYGTSFKNFGAYAEYICMAETDLIAIKPANFNYEEAASVPFGSTTALHFLRLAKIKPADKVLVYGASGSVGTAVVQLAKFFGAHVTAVCSTENLSLMKTLGADEVIDYTKENFSMSDNTFNIVFDAVGKSPFDKSFRALTENGYYLRMVHMSLSPIIKGLWRTLTTKKKVVGGVAKVKANDLAFITKLMQEDHLKPVIDKSFSLENVVEAHRYVEAGHKKGNVTMTM